jgi:hypothetical protein
VVNDVLKRAGHAVRIDDGTEVRIRASIGWFPRKGAVRLRMHGIDTAYTLGRLAEARQVLVQTLEAFPCRSAWSPAPPAPPPPTSSGRWRRPGGAGG